MSIQSKPDGTDVQDRTLNDLLESYRHLKSDPEVSRERVAAAEERIKPVWAKLAKLQDPNGLMNHISETVQREYQRRHNPAEGVERRGKSLCRCTRPRHVCEAKQGEVPSKIRTQDLRYLKKPSSRTLAREYIQEHAGDVIIREAMEDYRNLRAEIYAELSAILAMMRGHDAADGPRGASGEESRDDPLASADGGADARGGRDE